MGKTKDIGSDLQSGARQRVAETRGQRLARARAALAKALANLAMVQSRAARIDKGRPAHAPHDGQNVTGISVNHSDESDGSECSASPGASPSICSQSSIWSATKIAARGDKGIAFTVPPTSNCSTKT